MEREWRSGGKMLRLNYLPISCCVQQSWKKVEEKLLFVELSGGVSQRKSLFMLHREDVYQSSKLVEVRQTTRKHTEWAGTKLPRLLKKLYFILLQLAIEGVEHTSCLKSLQLPLILFVMFRQDSHVYFCCRNLNYPPSLCVPLALNLKCVIWCSEKGEWWRVHFSRGLHWSLPVCVCFPQ